MHSHTDDDDDDDEWSVQPIELHACILCYAIRHFGPARFGSESVETCIGRTHRAAFLLFSDSAALFSSIGFRLRLLLLLLLLLLLIMLRR